MSIIELDCANLASSGLICAHIRRYYPGLAGEPPVFCIFSDSQLPPGFRIESTPSDTGDECHREVFDVSNGQLKKLRERELGTYFICEESGYRSLTLADVS
jgi:hypothetical protein